jgi:hypothetical protein
VTRKVADTDGGVRKHDDTAARSGVIRDGTRETQRLTAMYQEFS